VAEERGWRPGPRIYNLFPLLAGPMPRWALHLGRARRLGFDWVFVNSFAYAGYSGSLYSIKDHFRIDPRLLDPTGGASRKQLEQVVETAEGLALRLMTDLVLNHTAFDSPLVTEHPDWYRRGADGKPVHPGAKDGDRWVSWDDLLEIDNAASPDRDRLWEYWVKVAEHYVTLGFTGFRCDAAYKVPSELWRALIGRVKQSRPDILFFAESLGCPVEDTVRLAQAGFDFVFNSSRWWNFEEPWCLEEYRRTAPYAPSISFPESHDTERLATELDGDQGAVKMRYAFAALFSTGVMMPIGFEYGFRRRLDVVNTRPEDWESPGGDLSDFITSVNRVKASHRVFNEEGPVDLASTGNPLVFAFVKSTIDGKERALVVLNRDRHHSQVCDLGWLTGFAVADISPEQPLEHTLDFQICSLKPSGVHVLYARGA
jgi:starch synthase (maltosyl-transferring)